MKLSDFLTHLGEVMQDAFNGDGRWLWKYAYFVRDAFDYICGEKPKYDLSDYLDDEGYAYWEDLENGHCDICWLNVDKGLYGFQISETYAYLPCYEDFLADIARALYGSADLSFQKKVEKEIKSMGFWNGCESPDLEDYSMDNKLIKAMLSIYPEFFQFAGKKEENVRDLIRLFFNIIRSVEECIGIGEWKLINVESLTLNAWLNFLYHCDEVSSQDRFSSIRILNKLVNIPITFATTNDEVYMLSHKPDGFCFNGSDDKSGCLPFFLTVMQNSFGIYNYGYEEGYFWFGLLNPYFLAVMMDVQDFLKNMDEKYHYLSFEQCRNTAVIKDMDGESDRRHSWMEL